MYLRKEGNLLQRYLEEKTQAFYTVRYNLTSTKACFAFWIFLQHPYKVNNSSIMGFLFEIWEWRIDTFKNNTSIPYVTRSVSCEAEIQVAMFWSCRFQHLFVEKEWLYFLVWFQPEFYWEMMSWWWLTNIVVLCYIRKKHWVTFLLIRKVR